MSFYVGELEKFLNNCKVVYSEDKYDFNDLKVRLSNSYECIFYPCSDLDTKPIHLLEESNCRELTNDNLKERRIYFLSDTSKIVLDKLKYFYHNLEDIDPSKEKIPFSICAEPHTINEIIPLKIYPSDFIKRLMNSTIEEYVGKENCKNTNYSCNKLIKETLSVWNNWLDSEWHCVYINIDVDNKYNINTFLFPSDNIIVWKEVIEKYIIPISYVTVFNEGAGGWDWQCREGAPLFNVISNTPIKEIRPKYWIYNKYSQLPKEWTTIKRRGSFEVKILDDHSNNRTIDDVTIYKTTW